MTEERKEGFYWVKIGGDWVPAEYISFSEAFGGWFVIGCEDSMPESSIEEVAAMIEPKGDTK